MAKREFLQLAMNYDDQKYGIGSWFASEKMDGMRAFWDGGWTRGRPSTEVPFANTEKDKRQHISTGLWSRYGKVIHAPDWWLDKLPTGVPLDGELYTDARGFQDLMSVVKDFAPGPGWRRVQFQVFDSPPLGVVLADGEISNPNMRKRLRGIEYPAQRGPTLTDFEHVLHWLRDEVPENEVLKILQQEQLHYRTAKATERLSELLFEVTARGGEGLMLRKPTSLWVPERCHTLLKVKKMQDGEGVVVGYTWGKATDRGSKLLGLMGALVLNYRGQTFELSGFTDDERKMATIPPNNDPVYPEHERAAREIGEAHPGERVGPGVFNPAFPPGSVVTFRFRELTDGGLPKEARYWRKSGGV